MESAIPPSLQCPRTRTRRIDDDYKPPYPAWVARGESKTGQVAMGYFGVQSKGREALGKACQALQRILDGFSHLDGPRHHDVAHYVDEAGYDTMIAIAYWLDAETFRAWLCRPELEAWWRSDERAREDIGYFREIFLPRLEGFETLFSAADRLEGIGLVLGERSEQEIQEHGYWGGARERLPLSQTDPMTPSGTLSASREQAGRVRVAGHRHVALIRSGQDWSDTQDKERRLYLEEMEPVLRAGMDYLRDHGLDIGCYFNRYMQHVDGGGKAEEKSFGYSVWHSLADMERWSESHPTHLAIFGTFMRIVQELQFKLDLRLYHEVAVLLPEEQDYEYVNCHPKTGMLAASGG